MKSSAFRKKLIWSAFFLGLFTAGVISFVSLLVIPGDEKNVLLFGFSLQRILLLAFIAVPTIAAMYLSIRAAFFSNWIDKSLEPKMKRLVERRWVSGICFSLMLIGWISLFLSPTILGRYQAYFVRLRPIILWLGFCAAWSFIVCGIWVKGWRPTIILTSIRRNSGLVRSVAISMVTLLAVLLLIVITRLGIKPDPFFWFEAGAPLLGLQLIFSVLIVMLLNRLVFSFDAEGRNRWLDLGLILVVWLIAFLLWQNTFMPRSYSAPGPYPPNWINYPYSDTEIYDTSAQYLLMGQGIANGQYMDKPAYVFLLGFLHLFAGQNYPLLISLQVALLAMVPVGLYILGKMVHSRQVGLLIALFAIFQQRNAIAATLKIQVAHSKLLFTEFPTALALIFFTIATVRWFQSPERRAAMALVSGGILGLAGLIRPNVLAIVPFVILVALILYRRVIKRGVIITGLFLGVFILTLLPWNLAIPKGFNVPYLYAKAVNLIRTRYNPDELEGSQLLPTQNQTYGDIENSSNILQPTDVPDPDMEFLLNPTETSGNFILQHYFHNEIMSFFILPHTIELQGLAHTIEAPYWDNISNWKGELPTGSILLIMVNLSFMATGVGWAWKRWQLAGMIPLLVHIVYYLANAIVRNSGARYLVPVDWVLFLYFGLGIIVVLNWIVGTLGNQLFLGKTATCEIPEKLPNNNTVRLHLPRVLMIGLLFLGIGSLLPLSKYVFPVLYPHTNAEQNLIRLKELNWDDAAAITWLNSIADQQIYDQPDVIVITGRGLYPRFYAANEGESDGDLSLQRLPHGDEPRFTLLILANDYPHWAILPMSEPPDKFPDGATVTVIGCEYKSDKYIDTAAILIETEPPVIFWRSSNYDLTCPLPLP